MDNNVFSARMKQAREEKKMGLKNLREACGVSQSAMSHYSTGKALPPLEVAARIADTLEVPLDWLCGTKMEKPVENLYTCGYVVRKMLDIEKGLTVNNSGCIYTTTDRYGCQVVRLETTNEEIIEFFHKNDKFSEMAKENSEAKEMYDAWLSGALAKLDNEIIKHEPF